MSLQGVLPFVLDFLPRKPIEIEVSRAQLTGDAGLLPIRQFDEAICLTQRFADALTDARTGDVRHSNRSLVRQRIYGILADYEDQNDHDALRSDPAFKLVCDRQPDGRDLASQPTLSRFENAVTIADLKRLRDVLCDQFLDAFAAPPSRITLDIDAFDDPAHGRQQLIAFHGYYEQYQYLPIAITCAETDTVALVGLRHGTCAAFLGADDDLRYLARRIRERFPDVEIVVRGDSGFGVPLMYDVCAELGLTHTFGLAMNARLKAASDALLAQAQQQFDETGEKQRLFLALEYQADAWPQPRQVVVKCEVHEQGTNRRAVSTNRPGWTVNPAAVYDEYAERGESENRNKELKRELAADRLSDHRFLANFFRLHLHTAALNLLVRLRRATARPLPTIDPSGEIPVEAFADRQRRGWFNRRRREDPLGEGFATTWRQHLIKAAAEITVSARRVVVKLSASWPYAEEYRRISQAVLAWPRTS
ncbi:IS1380 family transposase [Planctellipticum variicoloris]|uniref:IS1380 family transposase n=1 Tax=Planctellipticum variicoloris TaxID=3064265 RepID=UPI003013A0FE|nr:IS1380 family transposase [Planctomycetaceae bacterium SH412]WLD10690.1 IS1380 family transposase [Planctomycetaceae bacterium SH412]WLD13496.1 IS1380 family transposase [Planctomycetaceae bacterium SH412]